jgi:hypothetical protein
MRRLSFLLSLIAALAGTPLREAEAASDLACSLAELGDGDHVEEIDGGVGDDSGATITSKVADISVTLAVAEAQSTTIATFSFRGSPSQCRPDRSHRLLTDTTRRHAMLQCFRF